MDHVVELNIIFPFQTTYENFRYRADNRINVYNLGCLSNFQEVFCTTIKPSRNKFRAYVQEEVQRPPLPTSRTSETQDANEDRRMKVEDDLELGGDLMKISQRHNIEDIEADIRSRGSDIHRHNSSEFDSVVGSDRRPPTGHMDTRHSSWERRSGSWEIAQEVVGVPSSVTESNGYSASKEESK